MRFLLCLLVLTASVSAQYVRGGRIQSRGPNPPAVKPGPQGYVFNGDFSNFSAVENLWDGVNSINGLAGEAHDAYAVTESGEASEVALPVSVNLADMNGDGLPDIVSADPGGVMRIYFNSGTPTEPKFTVAETVPLFLARPAKDEIPDRWYAHGMPKISMYDWNKSGSLDLLMGNYCGDLVFIPNSGNASVPNFPQPPSYSKMVIPTSKKNQRWANLLAPCVYDWNKDGKPDILVGEGSYSANAIHLLLNEGGKFNEESRYFLCFGDGREHLVPTVVDWNGDGEPDVLVADRSGAVSVHIRQPGWKPGDEVKFTQFVDFGGTERLNTALTVNAGDINGDGLFDLLLGRADGRIQVAVNKGTKEQPKFDRPVDVKGTDLWSRNVLRPAIWTTDNGSLRGNLYGYVSVMPQASPGGGKILKMGYWPSPNKLIKLVHPTVAGKTGATYWRVEEDDRYWALDARLGAENKPTNCFLMRQMIWGLKVGSSYTLSFKTRGKKMSDSVCTLALFGLKELVATKYEKKERGTTALRNEKMDETIITEPLQQGTTWQQVNKNITITFKDKDVKTLTDPTFAVLEFKAFLGQYDGECEICDVSLQPTKQ